MTDFLLFIFVGFCAQIVDGAMGMAYGLIGSSVLIGYGVPPAMASASVHAAEVFTTAASGFSHWRIGNIDWKLVRRLAPAGMVGGAVGAFLLVHIPEDFIRFVVATYLLLMGVLLMVRAWRYSASPRMPRHLVKLGAVSGFLDAIGGGGWGALVTSNLLRQGTTPHIAIGSTSLAEFFVTATISATFVLSIGLEFWTIIAGLVIGGVIAAPLAAHIVRRVHPRLILALVGFIIAILALRTLWLAVS